MKPYFQTKTFWRQIVFPPFSAESLTTQEQRGAVCLDGTFSLNLPIFSVTGNLGILLAFFLFVFSHCE